MSEETATPPVSFWRRWRVPTGWPTRSGDDRVTVVMEVANDEPPSLPLEVSQWDERIWRNGQVDL